MPRVLIPLVVWAGYAERLIQDIDPDYMPGRRFKLAPYDVPLEQQRFARDHEGTRRFHIMTGPLAGVRGVDGGAWNGSTVQDLPGYMSVQVRYQIGHTKDHYRQLRDYVTHDELALVYWLQPAVGQWPADGPADCVPTGTAQLTRVRESGQGTEPAFDTYILDVRFTLAQLVGS